MQNISLTEIICSQNTSLPETTYVSLQEIRYIFLNFKEEEKKDIYFHITNVNHIFKYLTMTRRQVTVYYLTRVARATPYDQSKCFHYLAYQNDSLVLSVNLTITNGSRFALGLKMILVSLLGLL